MKGLHTTCRPLLTAAIAFVLALPACEAAPDCPGPASGWLHQVRPADCVSPTTGILPLRDLKEVAERLASSTVQSTIGVLDGPDEQVVGLVQDVVIDPRGFTIIADGLRRDVRVYAPTGQYVQTIGSAGSGPGEFRAPYVLAFDSRGVLYVGDRSLRIQSFALGEAGYEYVDQFRLEMSVNDLCILRDTMYVQGRHLGSTGLDSIIHKVTLGGESVESFGQAFHHADQVIVENYHRGRLACVEALDAIAFMPYQVPRQIRLYDVSGSLQWITTFPRIRELIIEAHPEGGYTQTIPEQGFHGLETLSVLDGDHFLIQFALWTREQPFSTRIPAQRQSYIVSTRTGRGGFLSDSLGAVVVERGRIVEIDHDPFPSITVRQ
jgi:hypothetical protein